MEITVKKEAIIRTNTLKFESDNFIIEDNITLESMEYSPFTELNLFSIELQGFSAKEIPTKETKILQIPLASVKSVEYLLDK